MINYTLNIYQEENNSLIPMKISVPSEEPLVVGRTVRVENKYYFVYESDLLHGELEGIETVIIDAHTTIKE